MRLVKLLVRMIGCLRDQRLPGYSYYTAYDTTYLSFLFLDVHVHVVARVFQDVSVIVQTCRRAIQLIKDISLYLLALIKGCVSVGGLAVI